MTGQKLVLQFHRRKLAPVMHAIVQETSDRCDALAPRRSTTLVGNDSNPVYKRVHLLLRIIATFLLPSVCFADGGSVFPPSAMVAGEVENPSRFEFTKAATLSAVFNEVTKPFATGATGRIHIYRNGLCRVYDLKKFGDVTVVDGDIVEVPIKFFLDEQAEDRVVPVYCEDPKALLAQVVMLKSDLWKFRTNWHKGVEGVEFRPTGKAWEKSGVSVFVRTTTQAELAAINGQKEVEMPKNTKALILICSDPVPRAIRSEFESKLVAQIRAIHGVHHDKETGF